MQAFGIFEGGGAKGLAHVGALAAVQRLNVQFVGVAGASAGAIVAALIAVGHRAKDLYDPTSDSGLLSGNLTAHFGAGMWAEWERFAADIEAKFADASALGGWLKAPSFYLSWRSPIRRMRQDLGFFDTAALERTFDKWLRMKIAIADEKDRVLFSDLDPNVIPPLRLIASDVERHVPVVFSREKTPDVPVARAIAASMAIPFFFRPVQMVIDGESRTLVDGGLVSNFPVWIFDDERRRREAFTPTLGFRLISEPLDPPVASSTPLSFGRALLETVWQKLSFVG